MQRKIKTLKVIGTVLLALQIIVYLSSFGKQSEKPTDTAELFGYYTGFNLLLIIAVILLINAYSLKKRLKKQEQQDLVDSIGQIE